MEQPIASCIIDLQGVINGHKLIQAVEQVAGREYFSVRRKRARYIVGRKSMYPFKDNIVGIIMNDNMSDTICMDKKYNRIFIASTTWSGLKYNIPYRVHYFDEDIQNAVQEFTKGLKDRILVAGR